MGATPIQNVGAYGQEVSETLTALRALDTTTGTIVTLGREDCGFAYRDSRFKSVEPGRHVILSVTYRLVPVARPVFATPRSSATWPPAASRRRRSPTSARA